MATKKENPETTKAVEENKKSAENQVQDDGKVDLYVEKGYANDEPNLLIAVNGVNYLLPKGKTSRVPKHIAEEYLRSRKAQETLDQNKDKMLEASK